jgi:predicted RNA-binding Zn-ribbon protein involved in translation (DUF1610 family)
MTKPKAKQAPAPEPEPKKNRGKYTKVECPYCGAHVGNLPNHIRAKHADQAKAEGFQVEKPDVTKGDLLGQSKPPDNLTPKPPIYYCTNCHAKLKKGENPCWKCGEYLVWEGIE